MADETLPLGFEIDTTNLARGKLDVASLVQSLQGLASTMGSLGGQATAFSQQFGGLTGQFAALGQGLAQGGSGGLAGSISGVTGALSRLAPALGTTAGALTAATAGVGALAAAYVGLLAVTVKQQEAFMVLEARLKNVYGSASVAADTFQKLTQLSQANGIAIESTAESFLRLARNNEAIGLTRDQMLELTDAVQKLGRVSGASQGELAGGLMQFSQALAAGRLNGDELRSIMENMPALAKSIADGLGVSVGQLRAMGAEGQLTSTKVVDALRSQIDTINEEFKGLPDTTEQAFTRVGNAWSMLLANMGEQLNSSGILTALGNGLASAVEATAEVVRPETPQERVNRVNQLRLDAMRMRLEGGLFNEMRATGFMQTYNREASAPGFSSLQGQVLTDQIKAQVDADRMAARSPFVAAQSVSQELDKTGTATKKLTEQIDSLDKAYKAFQENPQFFEPQEAERLAKFPEYIAALRTQLDATRTPLEDYINKTSKMAENLARYGAGGAASIGEEASALVSSMAKAGENISFSEAENAVLARRTTELTTQTEAMKLQIEEQRRMTEAVGQGADAQIEAEVATKALNLQLQLFGKDLTPEATRQMNQYRDGLRELLQVQRDLTNAQKEANNQQEIAIEQALIAAQRNGANAGELREIERNLRLIQTLQTEGVGSAVVGGSAGYVGPLPNGGSIPANRVDGNTVTAGLDASITQIVAAVMAAYPQVTGISGLRPGDTGSQHAVGKAFDLDLSRLPEAQRQALVSQLLSGAFGRVGGIGTYNDQASSLHIDTRDGRMAWGPNKSRSSLGQTPDWFEAMATSWMGGGSPGGSGVTAALSEAQLGALRTQREEEARLLELTRQRAALDEQIAASSEVQAKQAERVAQARDFAAGFAPERQQEAFAAKMAEFQKQDEVAAAQRRRALDEEIARSEDKLRIARLSGREYEIERRVLEEINAAKAQGLAFDEASIRAKITRVVTLEYDEKQTREDAEKFKGVWDEAAQGIGSALESAMRQAIMSGKVEAEDILKGLVADITMAIFRAYITKPLVDGLSGLIGSADGNVFSGGQRMAFAAGGVVASPTLFPMARGAGLMGEAGPEAIMPLKRGPDGKLGVASGGGGTQIVINDMRQAPGAEPVETQETTGPDGQRMIQILVRDEVRRQVRNGDLDREMRGSYGVTRQLTKR